MLHQPRWAHLHIIQCNSTYAANNTVENACLKGQLTHILNPACCCCCCCCLLLLLLPLWTKRVKKGTCYCVHTVLLSIDTLILASRLLQYTYRCNPSHFTTEHSSTGKTITLPIMNIGFANSQLDKSRKGLQWTGDRPAGHIWPPPVDWWPPFVCTFVST